MREISVAAGEAVYRAGEPSSAVYVVSHGEIAIRSGDDAVEIVRLHDGDLFGEAGVLENRPRSATAVALVQTTLLVTDAESFLKAFGIDNDRALSLLKLLCRRLRDTTRRATDAEREHEADGDDTPAPVVHRRLTLVPDSQRLTELIGPDTIEIRKFPFLVGNRYGGETSPISTDQNFSVPAAADPEFSAPHFEILRRSGRFVVRDLSHRSGTIVNKTVLSRYCDDSVAELHPGDNQIIAGRLGSPFRFKLVVGT